MSEQPDMEHMNYLATVVERDLVEIARKEASYKASWKRRGGSGAWHMVARKLDRLDGMMSDGSDDIFARIAELPDGSDGTVLAEVRDLRRYLTLIESEMYARHKLPLPGDYRPDQDPPAPGYQPVGIGKLPPPPDDGSAANRAHDLTVALDSEEQLASEAEARAIRSENRCGRYAELTLDMVAAIRPIAESTFGVDSQSLRQLIRRAEALAVPNHVLGI